ncbi:MAG: hypothetical protein ACR2JM_10295, partial [Mycobacterium sp.]
MQISLRSQLAAGVAFAGAAAIAVTPIAQPSILPALQTKASVALAAFDNPIAALVDTANLGVNYLLNGNYDLAPGGGAANWPGANIIDAVNDFLYTGFNPLDPAASGPLITSVGLLPNFIAHPFPIGLQVVNNLIGYAQTVGTAGFAALGDLSTVLWSPVGLGIAIAQDVLTGNFADIPVQINAAVTQAISGISNAIQDVVGAAVSIAGDFVAKVAAVATTLA